MADHRRPNARLPNPLALLAIVLSFSISHVWAATNRTIDDTAGDSVTGALPLYSPAGGWSNQDCTSCALHPSEMSQIFDGTWHSTLQHPSDVDQHSVSVSFSGAHHTSPLPAGSR